MNEKELRKERGREEEDQNQNNYLKISFPNSMECPRKEVS